MTLPRDEVIGHCLKAIDTAGWVQAYYAECSMPDAEQEVIHRYKRQLERLVFQRHNAWCATHGQNITVIGPGYHLHG